MCTHIYDTVSEHGLPYCQKQSEDSGNTQKGKTKGKTNQKQSETKNSFQEMILNLLNRRRRPFEQFDKMPTSQKSVIIHPEPIFSEAGTYAVVIPRFSGGSHSIGSSEHDDDKRRQHTFIAQSNKERWRSSEDQGYHLHAPLIAQKVLCSKERQNINSPSHSIAEEMYALNEAMERARKLPRTCYFSNNHIMVNTERTKRVVPSLNRNLDLDTLARWHAESMAASAQTFHSNPVQIYSKLKKPSRRIGENVAVGETIRDIHRQMMDKKGDRNNILDRRYTEMGMGTAKGRNGELYLCQIFRG